MSTLLIALQILLTPLTRRVFSGSKVVPNLAEQRNATIAVAQSNDIRFIDLNLASENYVNAIGKEAASQYNLASNDWTHLNEWGGVVFARIVSFQKHYYSMAGQYVVANCYLGKRSSCCKISRVGRCHEGECNIEPRY